MDVLGTYNSVATVSPGETFVSDLSSATDVDWIKLTDTVFPFDDGIMRIQSDEDLSDAEVVLYREVFDRNGRFFEKIATIASNADGTLPDVTVSFGDDYFVAITGFIGSYDIDILSDAEKATYIAALPADDAGESGLVALGVTVSGALQHRLDEDVYEIDLEGGKAYTLDMLSGLGLTAADGEGEVTIRNASGQNVLYETGVVGATEFVVDTSGTYSIHVRLNSYDTRGGLNVQESYSDAYALEITETGSPVLPGGESANDTVVLAVGVTHAFTLGERGYAADGGWFSFLGDEGKQYSITVTGTFARVALANDFYELEYYASSSVTPNGESLAIDYTAVLSADELKTFQVISFEETDDVTVTIEETVIAYTDAPFTLTLDQPFVGLAAHRSFGQPYESFVLDVEEGTIYTITVEVPDGTDTVFMPPALSLAYGSNGVAMRWDDTSSRSDGVSVFQFVALQDGAVTLDMNAGGTSGTSTNSERQLPLTQYVGPVDITATAGVLDDRAGTYSALAGPMDVDVVTSAIANGGADQDAFVVLLEAGTAYTFLANTTSFVALHRTDRLTADGWDPVAASLNYVFTPTDYNYGATYAEQNLSTLADNMFLEKTYTASATAMTFVADYSGYAIITMSDMPASPEYSVLLTEGDASAEQLAALGQATSGNDTLTGTAGVDVIDGLAGDDLIAGLAEDDELIGGTGADTLRGGEGDDTVYGGIGADVVVGNGGADVLRGGSQSDRLFGGADNDTLAGNSEADTLDGGAGADVLYGGSGDDELVGGEGTDTLRGDAGDDRLEAGTGDDILVGNDGNDSLFSGDGNDVLFAGSGNDLLSGGEGNDNADGGTGNDRIYGNNGADTLNGQDGQDQLSGGIGNDTLFGGADRDTLRGGNDNDRVSGDGGDDILSGNSGDDTLLGGDGDDRFYGGAGTDVLAGNLDDDLLAGGAGNDHLYGGGGEDTLNGGAGTDVLTGGADADVFVFASIDDSLHGNTRDKITDFTHGVDQIDLSGIIAGASFIGNGSYSNVAGEVRYNDVIGRLYLDVDGDGASDLSIDLSGAPVFDLGDLIL